MAPTPNKRGIATATSTSAMSRTPSKHKPPRSTTPQCADSDAPGGATASTSGTMKRLVDELSNPPLPGVKDRQEAFESARKRFAMYGKQNAHVSHYSPDQHQALVVRNRQRGLKKSQGSAASQGRRLVDWEDEEGISTNGNTVVVQNTVLLQENGELAAQLDDMEYHLDGILDTAETEDQSFAIAASVVALTKLLQLEQIQTVMKVTSHGQQLMERVREVLYRLRTFEHRMLRLTVAVMAYLLTVSTDADEFYSENVIDGVVAALEVETRRWTSENTGVSGAKSTQGDATVPLEPTTESKTPLKKSFLKRKKSGYVRRIGLAENDEFAHGNDDMKDDSMLELTRASAQREESLRADLRTLLSDHDVFLLDGQMQLSTADLLCMLLHNILQVGGASGGETTDASSGHTTKQKPAQRFHRREDLAGTTFETIKKRKKQLIQNGGVALLLRVLEKRFDRLHKDLKGDLLHSSVSLELTCAFQRVRIMLRVLDQASFLAIDVQLLMSKDEMVFRVALSLIEVLSNLTWSYESRKKWQSDPTFIQLIVDVLMAAMRVLINLSHQNEDANAHIAKLEGTKILFTAFCKLWGTVELEQASDQNSKGQHFVEDKVSYDAMLLILSAITNCIEYSPENREQLSKIDLSTTALDGLETFRSSCPCSLLVSFFVSKVQSYIHLFEISDSQREIEEETWVPEDVVLGGCASLLLGCLMKDSSYNSAIILGALPDASPRLLLRALSAFVALHSQIGALTPEVGKSVLEVEKLLKSFTLDGSQRSPTPVRSSNEIATGEIQPSEPEVHMRKTPSRGMEITIEMTPVSKIPQMVAVQEVKNGGPQEVKAPSHRAITFQQTLQTPPASAFRLQRFSRVCSNVDDSDEVESDDDPMPVKKKRQTTAPKSPPRPPPKSPVRSAPKNPARSAPKSPGRSVPKSPVRSTPKSPSRLTPKSPARSPSKSPSRSAPKSPSRLVPKSPSQFVPKSPSRLAPKSPSRLAPRSPSHSVPKSPAQAVPKSPSRFVPRSASPFASKSPSRSPARTTLNAMVALTGTPPRRVSDSINASSHDDLDNQGALSIQRRLKRTRQLVSDLEVEFMKIGSRVGNEISGAAAMTSTEDGYEETHADLSHDLFSSHDTVQETTQRPPKISKTLNLTRIPKMKRSIKPQTFVPSKKGIQTPLTHKRKAKATPARTTKKQVTLNNADDVFDFPG